MPPWTHKLFVLYAAMATLVAVVSCSVNPPQDRFYRNGVVVSSQKIASQAGVDILKKGGNAVDAAVAVAYALAVVHPAAGNIGGGGFMVIRSSGGKASTIDFREKAPARATRNMFLDEKSNVVPGLSTDSPLAIGVPGTVAGTLYALEKYGTMTRQEVIQSAIDLAREGFILETPLGGDEFRRYPSTDEQFNKPDGSRYEPGERFIQKDLAHTLEIISENGRDGFYSGDIADAIVTTVQRYGGIITHDDLLRYDAVERKPVTGSYRGYGIVSIGPPSSGGIALIQLLNILERYDISSLGWNTPETVHLMTEAERRVFADRAEYLGDSDFFDVPVDVLLSKEYAGLRAGEINPTRATPSDRVTHGNVSRIPLESEETTHFSVVDGNGMAVAVTTTLNGSYGSHLVVDGAGFLLNNEMDDFSIKPGTPNAYGLLGGEANAIEPEKRMLSSMSPTIVTKNGKNFMVIGTPGGSTIITTVLQCIVNVIDHGMTIQEAVNAGRFHHQWYPDIIQYEKMRNALSEETVATLEAMGHSFSTREIGRAHGIIIDPENGLYSAGVDPRIATAGAAGY